MTQLCKLFRLIFTRRSFLFFWQKAEELWLASSAYCERLGLNRGGISPTKQKKSRNSRKNFVFIARATQLCVLQAHNEAKL